MQTIASLRQDIDQIHKELHALFLRRCDLTVEIWKIKQAEGQPFFNAEREAQILEEFVAIGGDQGKDPAKDQLLTNLMKSILREYEAFLKSKFP